MTDLILRAYYALNARRFWSGLAISLALIAWAYTTRGTRA